MIFQTTVRSFIFASLTVVDYLIDVLSDVRTCSFENYVVRRTQLGLWWASLLFVTIFLDRIFSLMFPWIHSSWSVFWKVICDREPSCQSIPVESQTFLSKFVLYLIQTDTNLLCLWCSWIMWNRKKCQSIIWKFIVLEQVHFRCFLEYLLHQ